MFQILLDFEDYEKSTKRYILLTDQEIFFHICVQKKI